MNRLSLEIQRYERIICYLQIMKILTMQSSYSIMIICTQVVTPWIAGLTSLSNYLSLKIWFQAKLVSAIWIRSIWTPRHFLNRIRDSDSWFWFGFVIRIRLGFVIPYESRFWIRIRDSDSLRPPGIGDSPKSQDPGSKNLQTKNFGTGSRIPGSVQDPGILGFWDSRIQDPGF